ncbi:hypothetical protein E4T66_15010 [Sinimarinibacterium sp. CAU 1509]|uniref:hypothetical protein n=1 Tax=Sinimarinibacterium sp. CAU 1509 TaxID=2562283 RepID=UPI0010AB5FB2|nr:hypothetical protein [Sinimarinibacterium sp. CAU 1509]TJY58904.1 hypothetical protein E4T66_15010 [Sinimarinibacterium sp. CAU 1509]
MNLRRCLLLIALLLSTNARAGGPAPFDLTGPVLDMVVTRGTMILPASEVPHLAVGDRIWIKPEFPETQSAHYLMVAVFLSGPTNPPPENWFFACKTWKGPCASEGLTVTVPKGAQQALVFLAPETSGDFKGIMNAVRGKPGAFVRATQDLNQAQLDRSRLERYLAAVHHFERGDPAALKQAAPLLARSLAIKVDERCLDRIPQLQAACLTENQDALILNDGHSMSIAQTLTSGPVADLVMAASATPELGYGVYSPYIASVLDIVRIFDSFGTALYQYIPALTSFRDDKLALTLNTPPSFRDPKSVLVVGLPAIEAPHPPPLRAVNPADIYCANRDELVLPVEGAPLAFSTRYAHDLTLNLSGDNGKTVRLPALADATRGGYVVRTTGLKSAGLGDTLTGVLQGYWGFDLYQGPRFQLKNARATNWALGDDDTDALVVGRPDTIHLRADSVSCVDEIMLRDATGKELKVDWKVSRPGEVEVTLPLQHAEPGAMTVLVGQSGVSEPHSIPIRVFASASHLDGFAIHAGDSEGQLRGSRLDQVASLSVGDIQFVPGTLATQGPGDVLTMVAQNADAVASLVAGSTLTARAQLSDGRSMDVAVTVEPPRPSVTLIGRSIIRPQNQDGGASTIKLGDADQLPQNARLVFSIRAQAPALYQRAEVIDIAASDEAFSTTLSIANGGVRLENKSVALVTLEPAKAFGFSAFGPLKFRARIGDVAGDWQPLATLVRLPQLNALECPQDTERACKLSGSDLFLIDAVSGNAGFDPAVRVSDGFPGASLPVPHPQAGTFYIRLRDDPDVINPVSMSVQVLPPAPDEIPAVPASSGDAAQNAVQAPMSSVPAAPATSAPDAATTP